MSTTGPGARLGRRVLLTVAAACVLATLMHVASSVSGPGARTLGDWQRDLRHPSADVRVRAAKTLVVIDQRAVAALTRALGDGEYRVRTSAAEALVGIGPGLVLPGMIDSLRDAEVAIRANAAVVLGAFGPAAKPAIPALARALKDTHPRVRELAGEALNRIAAIGPSEPATLQLNCH